MLCTTVIFALFALVRCVPLGVSENYMMIGSISQSLTGISQTQCTCEMLGRNLFQLNYVSGNETCLLFEDTNATIYIQADPQTLFMFVKQASISIVTSSSTVPTPMTTSPPETFTPSGIYALTIPTCATWDPCGITVAGNANGTQGSDRGSLYTPVGIFLDNSNVLYVTDRDNHRIVKYYENATEGIVVAGNLTAGSSSSQLNAPKAVAVDQYGALIVADSSNYRVQRFAPGSLVGTTIVMNSSTNPLGQMRDLHIDVNNNIVVTDSTYDRVLMFPSGSSTGMVLAPAGGSGTGADQLSAPYGNFIDGNGVLYVADQNNHRAQRWPAGASSGTTVAGVTRVSGSNATLLSKPQAIIVDNNGFIYVLDSGNNRVMKWTTDYAAGGTCIVGCTSGSGAASNQLLNPRDLKFDRHGNLYVTDQGNHRVQKYLIQLPSTGCPSSDPSLA